MQTVLLYKDEFSDRDSILIYNVHLSSIMQ